MQSDAADNQLCKKTTGPDLQLACQASCGQACTGALDEYANRDSRLTGYSIDGKVREKLSTSCARQCTYECAKPGDKYGFAIPYRSREWLSTSPWAKRQTFYRQHKQAPSVYDSNFDTAFICKLRAKPCVLVVVLQLVIPKLNFAAARLTWNTVLLTVSKRIRCYICTWFWPWNWRHWHWATISVKTIRTSLAGCINYAFACVVKAASRNTGQGLH